MADSSPDRPLIRHPRRLGFTIFNVLVLVVLSIWTIASRQQNPDATIADLPNYTLGFVAVSFTVAAWVVAWIAWAIMVVRRRARIAELKAQQQ